MKIEVARVDAREVAPLRELHRQEMNCQIVHDSFLGRGFSDPYLICVGGRLAGYGLVANKHYPDTVDEFYTFPAYRAAALPMFRELLQVSQASRIRVQTNDRLLLMMLYDCATNITSEAILFEDGYSTYLTCPAGALRPGPEGDWVIENDGVTAAKGGVLCHYNPPYGDIYMEVDEAYRQRGYGSYLVQELKRIAYEMGKKPAARCNVDNLASRRTLQKAGMLPCGRILLGDVVR